MPIFDMQIQAARIIVSSPDHIAVHRIVTDVADAIAAIQFQGFILATEYLYDRIVRLISFDLLLPSLHGIEP